MLAKETQQKNWKLFSRLRTHRSVSYIYKRNRYIVIWIRFHVRFGIYLVPDSQVYKLTRRVSKKNFDTFNKLYGKLREMKERQQNVSI